MRKYRGFTLLELVITLSIGALLAAISIPAVSRNLDSWQLRADLRELNHLIRYARSQAMNTSSQVTLCPLNTSQQCSRNWRLNITAFSDKNRNNRLDSSEVIHKRYSQQGRKTSINFAAFGPGYLRFQPNGLASDNGAFTVCPRDADIKKARQVVINRSGRAYISKDKDGDGVVEYGNDKEPRCTATG